MSESQTEEIPATSSTLEGLAPEVLLKNEIEQVNKIYDIIFSFLTNYSFQLIGAVIILAIGYFVADKIALAVHKVCSKHKLDITLSRFLTNTTKVVVLVLVGIIALGKLGISVTPFIAAIGAISLGAGLAIQGLLANYAAGFNIIFIRPFVVGDTITVQGTKGIVKEVLLAYTVLIDEDEVEITIPNKHIVGEVIKNSKQDSLLELTIGVAYQHNPKEVVALIQQAIDKLDIVSQSRAPQVGIDEFSDSSINIAIRLWTPTEGLYPAKFKAYQAIYEQLQKHEITIPFPQREVTLLSTQASS